MTMKIKTLFDSKIFWMIASLLASLLLWVYVTTTERNIIEPEPFRDVQVVFRGQSTLNSRGLIVTGANTSLITVRLRGNRRDLYNLKSSELTAVVDVSSILQAQDKPLEWGYTLTFPSRINDSDIEIVWASTDTISFNVDKITSKQIDIIGMFDGSLAENCIQDPVTVSPARVRVSGAERELEKISHALVVIERENVDSTISMVADYKLIDFDGNELNSTGLTLETREVSVNMPILMMKEVELRIDWEYSAGTNAANVFPRFEPQKLVIAGPREVIEPVNTISVGKLNLSSFASSYEDTFTISLRDDVRNISGVDTVKVSVEIVGLSTEKFTVTNIECVNIPAGYAADIITESIEITLRGQKAMLDQIQVEDIRAVLDLVDLNGAVSATLPVTVYVDGFPDVGALFEPKAVVSLKEGAVSSHSVLGG